MFATQRHLTALAAVAVAMLVSVACAASDRTDLSVSADGGTGDGGTTSTTADLAVATTVATDSTDVVGGPSTLSGADATTETSPPTLAPSTTSTPPRPTSTLGSDAEMEGVEDALEREDICGVYAGLATIQLDSTSNARLVSQLTGMRDVMTAASAFAPAAVQADWSTVTDGTSDMIVSLQGGTQAGAAAEMHYDEDEYRAASKRIETWMTGHCG